MLDHPLRRPAKRCWHMAIPVIGSLMALGAAAATPVGQSSEDDCLASSCTGAQLAKREDGKRRREKGERRREREERQRRQENGETEVESTGDSPVRNDPACAITRQKGCDIGRAVARGLFQTGTRPQFAADAQCPNIDEQWAISYTHKRGRENYHGGIDMPAPTGTPIIAAAAGTVVSKYDGEKGHRGIEIILQHSPEDTGLPMWTYSQYAHFDKVPEVSVGQRVSMGQVLGPTGNSGKQSENAKRARRPAIHFAIYYSATAAYEARGRYIVPQDGWWMDPVAFYRTAPPYDSAGVKALPADQKRIPIPYMTPDGQAFPTGTKVIWPYFCKKR